MWGFLNMEIWRDIPNYNGFYSVSTLGRVKTLKRKGTTKDRILKDRKHCTGYIQYRLSKKGKSKYYFGHQLVAMAFLNFVPCGIKLQIHHKNEVITDNRLDNIEVLESRIHCRMNDRKSNNSSSKYVGVDLHKQSRKWRARIVIDGKSKHLGLFNSENDAHNAYQSALKTHLS